MANLHSPVGVFDSGVGGISTLGAMLSLMPEEHFIYFGDIANAPYGTKNPEEVQACVDRVIDRLCAMDVKAVAIACNTATAVAAASLRARLTLPVIGIEPALKPAHELRKTGQILVMATPVTLKLPKFGLLYAKYGEGAVPLPCPGLMELVEQEDFAGAREYLREKFAPFDPARMDAVVLGCTHYVFLKEIVRELVPAHTAVLDGNEGTARQLKRVLEGAGLKRPAGLKGSLQLMTSGDPERDLPIMKRLLTRSCPSYPVDYYSGN